MLERIKQLLGISDNILDDQLRIIISLTEERLRHLLGGVESVPESLSYITVELSVARFNRIGSEGLSSHSVEGESMSWSEDDFTPYKDDIQDWLDMQQGTKKGRVRFL